MAQPKQVINNQTHETLPIVCESSIDAVSRAKEAELNAVSPAIIQGDNGILVFLVLLIVALIITVGAVGAIMRIRSIQASMQQELSAQVSSIP